MKHASTFLSTAPQGTAGATSKSAFNTDLPTVRFGEALYNRRTERGWSQGYVASAAGLSIGYLSELENGRRRPPPHSTVLKLAHALRLQAESVRALVFFAERERVRECASAYLPSKVQDLVALINAEGHRLPSDLVDLISAKIKEVSM